MWVSLEPGRARRGAAYSPFPNSRLVSRITVEEGEEEPSRPSNAARHPTITLDLQVRRVRPGENRDQDSIASRTRSRTGLAENTVTVQSRGGGFRRTVSHLERSGIRTYVSTITVPLRRMSENELVEPSSVALRSILRQIMTGFGELSSLMEAESEGQSDGPHSPGMLSQGGGDRGAGGDVARRHEASSRGRWAREDGAERGGDHQAARPHTRHSGARGARLSRSAHALADSGTLPILRLAHFFLLNEGDGEDHVRGLTKEQIDNLATRSYEHDGVAGDPGRVCSVCISDYVAGNKLRRLPCAHEFHVHCIDRWLSENCTCPVCRQPVLGSSGARDA